MAVLLLSLQTTWALSFRAYCPLALVRPRHHGLKPCMAEIAADDVQAQIDILKAQLQMAQLQAQISELENQKAAELPSAAASAAPSAPADLVVPSAPQAVVPSAPLPVDDVATCATLRGETIPCQQPGDLVDLNELTGGLKSVNQVFDTLPSWEQLQSADTVVPIIGGLVALVGGLVIVSKVSEWLRPDDAATARRKREERERLGVSEWDQEQNDQIAQDRWIEAVVPAVLIIVFELVLFNLRNL